MVSREMEMRRSYFPHRFDLAFQIHGRVLLRRKILLISNSAPSLLGIKGLSSALSELLCSLIVFLTRSSYSPYLGCISATQHQGVFADQQRALP